jgi:hypothetical protein
MDNNKQPYSIFFYLIISLVLFVIFFLTFLKIGNLEMSNDLSLHHKSITDIGKGYYKFKVHFIYHYLVAGLSLLSTSYYNVLITGSSVLAIAILGKFYLTNKILLSKVRTLKFGSTWVNASILLALGLAFFTNLPSRPPWENVVPPPSFQNSTTIFLFPFAIFLFIKSFLIFNKSSSKNILALSFLGIITLFIKPNFGIALIPAFIIFSILKYKISKKTMILVTPLFLMGVIIIAQYFLSINLVRQDKYETLTGVKAVIAPFSAWSRISGSIPISFIIWCGYPLSVLILYWKRILKSQFFQFGGLIFIFSFIIFILFEEKTLDGATVSSVNFIWQTIIGHYILCLVTLRRHLTILKTKKIDWKDVIIFIVFAYYVFSGIMYLINTVLLAS